MKVIKRQDNFPVYYAEAKDFERRAALTNRAGQKERPRTDRVVAQARKAWDDRVMGELTHDEKALLPIIFRLRQASGYGKWTTVGLALVQKGLLTQTPEGKFILTPGGMTIARRLAERGDTR